MWKKWFAQFALWLAKEAVEEVIERQKPPKPRDAA